MLINLVIIPPQKVSATSTVIGDRDWRWPVPSSKNISSCFPNYCGHGSIHHAIDISANHGEEIYASYDGNVLYTDNSCTDDRGKENGICGCGKGGGCLGKSVYILHSYKGHQFVSRYGHMSAINVLKGQHVDKNTVIGRVGSTGSSTGNHLDFTIWEGNSLSKPTSESGWVDPFLNQFLEKVNGLTHYGCNDSYVDDINRLYGGGTSTYDPKGCSYESPGASDVTNNTANITTWVSNDGRMDEIAWTRFFLNYKLENLSPGEKYYYQFYVLKSGKEYKSDKMELITSGNKIIGFDTYAVLDVTDVDASVGVWLDNPNGNRISEIGIEVRNNTTSIAKKKITGDIAWTRSHLNYYTNRFGINLEPSTYYNIRYYVVVNGTTYNSDWFGIQTKAGKVSFDTSSNKVSENDATLTTWGSNTGEMEQIGFYMGTSTNSMKKYPTRTEKTYWTRFFLEYNVRDYLGKLSDNTKYYYQYYVVSDGHEYRSSISYFVTPKLTINDDFTKSYITEVSISNTTYTYSGKEITPEVKVWSEGNIVPKSEYIVSYINNKNVGIGKVVVKGKGKYSGSVSKTFNIVKANNKITVNDEFTKTAKSSSKKQFTKL